MHILDKAIVANRYVVQCRILNGRMTLESFFHINHTVHCSDFYFAVEVNIANKVRHKSFIYEDFAPVFCRTSMFLQNGNLCVCKFSHIIHNL